MKVKRFLLYTFVYIVATLSAVLGTLGVNALIKHGQADISQNGEINKGNQTLQASDGEKLLNGLMSLDTTKVNLTFDVFANESTQTMSVSDFDTRQSKMTVNFNGDVSINGLTDIKLSGDLFVKMPDKDICISISYLGDMLYLSTGTMDIKLSTKSIDKIFSILPTLGLDLDIVANLPEIDADALMNSFVSLKAIEQDNGDLLLPFTILDGLSLDIYTDSEYKIKDVVANKINFAGIQGSLNATLTPDDATDIIPPDTEKEFVDVTHTFNVLDSVKEILTSKKAHFDVNAVLRGANNFALDGVLDLDFGSNTSAYTEFALDLNGNRHTISVGYVGDELYLSIDTLNIRVAKADIIALANLLKDKIGNKNIADMVVNLLAGNLPNLDIKAILSNGLKNIDINNLMKFAKGEDNVIKITILGKGLGIENDINIAIGLDDDNQFSSLSLIDLNVAGYKLDLTLNYSDIVDIPTLDKQQYSQLTNLDGIMTAVESTIARLKATKQLALDFESNLVIKGKSVGLNGKIYVNASRLQTEFAINDLSIYANVNLTLDGKAYALTIRLDNGILYVDYLGLKLKIACTSINDLIDTIQKVVPIDIDTNTFARLLAGSIVSDIIAKDYSNISLKLIKQLSATNNELSITLDKSVLGSDEDVNLVFGYDNALSSVRLSNVTLGEYQIGLNAKLDYDFTPNDLNVNEYQNISGIDKALNSILNTIDKIKTNKTIALSISNADISLNGKTFRTYGSVYLDFSKIKDFSDTTTSNGIMALNGYVHLNLTANGGYSHDVTIFYNGERIYLTYNSLNVCLGVGELDSIVDVVLQLKFLSESLKTQDMSNISMRALIEESKDKVLSQKGKIDLRKTISQILPHIDIDAIKSGDISSIDLAWVKGLSLGDNRVEICLDKAMFDAKQDLSIAINYADTITGVEISHFAIKGVSVAGSVNMLDDFVPPKMADASKYCSLDSLQDAINSTFNTAIDVVDNKQIAFGLKTNLVHTSLQTDARENPTKAIVTTIYMLDGSNARFEWKDAYETANGKTTFNIKKMRAYVNFEVTTVTEKFDYSNGVRATNPYSTVTKQHSIEITFIDNELYIRYNNMYAKIGGDNIENLIRALSELLNVDFGEIDVQKVSQMIDGFDLDEMLNRFKVEMIEKLSISNSNIAITIDITDLGLDLDEIHTLKLDVDYDENSLTSLVVKDLTLANNHIDSVSIALRPFTAIANAPKADYIDLAGVENLIDALANSKQFKDFEIDGSINLKLNVIGIKIDWNIPVNVKVKLLDDNKYEVNARIGAIPVVPGVNDDVPFKAGNVTSGIYSGLNRILNVYIKDEMVYLYRSETVPTTIFQKDRLYEKKMKVHIDTLLDEPLYYILQYGFGFSKKIMTEINKLVNKERQNPLDYSNVLKGFGASDNYYSLVVNLKELAEDDKLGNMTVGVRTQAYNNEKIVGGLTMDMHIDVASSVEIDLKSDNLNLVNIGKSTDMQAMYSFVANNSGLNEGASWDAYDGDWTLSSQREFVLYFETNCDQTIANIKGIAGTEFTLPTLTNFYKDTTSERTYYTFAGWYTTKDFEPDSKYNQNIMPRRDTIVYAKWETEIVKYVTIDFVANGGETKDSITLLAGTEFELPKYDEPLVEKIGNTTYTKQFDGWFMNAELTDKFESKNMPNDNVTLYAKWTVVKAEESYLLEIYDNEEKIYSHYVVEGNRPTIIDARLNDTTLYYSNAECTTAVDFDTFAMPNADVKIYIRNCYTLTIKSAYGTVLNSTQTIYQGEKINLTQQASYYKDVSANGVLSKRYCYTFNGYYVGNVKLTSLEFTMPNANTEIVANWTEQIKNYYTITFNTKTTGLSSANGGVTVYSNAIALEGTTFDLSGYKPTCKYKWGITYHCDFKGWQLNGQYVTSFVVTGNTTVSAKWSTPYH